MNLNLPKRIWVYIERLFIHCFDIERFKYVLSKYSIEYESKYYKDFHSGKNEYLFMSEENYDFANFMQTIPTYKHLKLLEDIIFRSQIIKTKEDNWNYYGEFIKNWYPTVIELLELSNVDINYQIKSLTFEKELSNVVKDDLLIYAFNDPFLDYLRKEINESYQNNLYL